MMAPKHAAASTATSSLARHALLALVALLVLLDGNGRNTKSTAFQLTSLHRPQRPRPRLPLSTISPRGVGTQQTPHFAASPSSGKRRNDDDDKPVGGSHRAASDDDVAQVGAGAERRTMMSRRVAMMSSSALLALFSTGLLSSSPPAALAADEGFESIAARASRLSREVEGGEDSKAAATIAARTPTADGGDDRTAYDFSVPVRGKEVNVGDFVGRSAEGDVPKAFLVVNMKQDDPVARKNIPALISLGARFGKDGQFAVICVPTDQGYYEPDTSALIRLKLASEYGYGINPALLLTDKVILLGTGAHPFMRWIQGKCRTPAGLGKIQANFEKFLVDGRTGLPVRRYPRKYSPDDMADDIDALVKGKPLPPPGANYAEEWRNAAVEAERDQFRFQKGLNVFDQ